MKELQEAWASGQFTDLHRYGTAILNAKAVGTCEAYRRVNDVDYSQLMGVLADEE